MLTSSSFFKVIRVLSDRKPSVSRVISRVQAGLGIKISMCSSMVHRLLWNESPGLIMSRYGLTKVINN